MKVHDFQILLALSESELHATAIARRVREQTDDAVQLWPVTLHRALDRLQDDKLIVELGGAAHPEGKSRRRRYYRLTKKGARQLGDEAEALQSFAEAAKQNLRGNSWRTT